jgi:hypothetical protein
MGILDLAARVRAAVKLRRGKCRWCYATLPDNATSRYCNAFCEDAQREDSHPII